MDKIKPCPTFFLFEKPFHSNIHHKSDEDLFHADFKAAFFYFLQLFSV